MAIPTHKQQHQKVNILFSYADFIEFETNVVKRRANLHYVIAMAFIDTKKMSFMLAF